MRLLVGTPRPRAGRRRARDARGPPLAQFAEHAAGEDDRYGRGSDGEVLRAAQAEIFPGPMSLAPLASSRPLMAGTSGAVVPSNSALVYEKLAVSRRAAAMLSRTGQILN